MNTPEKNKQFMMNYYREMVSALKQSPEILHQTQQRLIETQKLIDHIGFFYKTFPGYEVVVKELIAEGEKVFVKIDFIGVHKGVAEEIPATEKAVTVPFALCYTIRNEKIVDFWAIANEMEFFEQLGLSRDKVDVPE